MPSVPCDSARKARAVTHLEQAWHALAQGTDGVRQRPGARRALLRKSPIHDNRAIDANISSLLDRGATDKAALIVPDGPTLTYGRLRELTEEASRAIGSRRCFPTARRPSFSSWPRR